MASLCRDPVLVRCGTRRLRQSSERVHVVAPGTALEHVPVLLRRFKPLRSRSSLWPISSPTERVHVVAPGAALEHVPVLLRRLKPLRSRSPLWPISSRFERGHVVAPGTALGTCPRSCPCGTRRTRVAFPQPLPATREYMSRTHRIPSGTKENGISAVYEELSPVGTADNSPPLQWWEPPFPETTSPVGTADNSATEIQNPCAGRVPWRGGHAGPRGRGWTATPQFWAPVWRALFIPGPAARDLLRHRIESSTEISSPSRTSMTSVTMRALISASSGEDAFGSAATPTTV